MSHPDASVAHSRPVSRALCVDEGLWVVNRTFNLPHNRKKSDVNPLETRVINFFHKSPNKPSEMGFSCF